MKIPLKILLTAVFTFVAFAKTIQAASVKETQLEKTEITKLATKKENPVDEKQIQPFDFQKLFSEAQNYYKASKAWKSLKCEPKSGFICTKWECVKRETKSFLLLDKKAKTITHCEGKDCETFAAEFEQNGVFYNIQSQGPIGTLIRILGDSRYKEITTIGLDAYIANGNCEVTTK
jgi:hypothetical protein